MGDGNYTWDYWNGNKWTPLSLTSDNTESFTKSGTIEFSPPDDWKKKRLFEEFFNMEYYYIRCGSEDLDNGTIRMNVNESSIGDYNLPSSSYLETKKNSNVQTELTPLSELPKLDEMSLPLHKGLLQTDLDIIDYLEVNGLDFDTLVFDLVLPSIQDGMNSIEQRDWISVTDDEPSIEEEDDDVDFDIILDFISGFSLTHDLDLMEFLIACEFEWESIFTYIGENFIGWSAPNGTDIVTNENIYTPIYETVRYKNAIQFSYVLMIGLFVMLGIIFPYFAQKKQDQTFIFDDIKNLDRYLDKVKKDIQKGITEDEISLLKQAAFKDKTIIDKKEEEDKI
ncbi:MAG: hypothetical protein ACOC44_19370 [Promethearchaeia archaeon]